MSKPNTSALPVDPSLLLSAQILASLPLAPASAAANVAHASTEYETGVSNGDVDWLFRGKSKKLTKKMNNEKPVIPSTADKRVLSESKDDLLLKKAEVPVTSATSALVATATVPAAAATASSDSTLISAKPTATGANGARIAPATPHLSSVPSTVASAGLVPPSAVRAAATSTSAVTAHPPGNTASASTSAISFPNTPATASSKLSSSAPLAGSLASMASSLHTAAPSSASQTPAASSSFFKLGRARSSSESSNTTSRQRGGFGFIPSSSASSNPAALPPLNTAQEPSSSAGTTPVSPANVSRSNSSSKRSLFSSISSKFKSSQLPSSTEPTPSSHANGEASSKPQINFLGVSGSHHAQNQDLAALINKPPSDIPRRASLGTQPASAASSSRKASSSSVCGVNGGAATASHLSTTNPVQAVTVSDAKSPRAETLRRVTFAIDQLAYDPQQQIPSRRPKKGNVIIPEDLVAPPPRLSQGISLSDGKNPVSSSEVKYTEKELQLAIEAQRKALLEAEKHAHEAHLAARRIAHEVSQFKVRTTKLLQLQQQAEDDCYAEKETADIHLQGIEIDKPIHVHENYFPDDHLAYNVDGILDEDELIESLSLETIYTRCCHLREILPIPATLKQLKNKSKNLQVLKMLNPKPTLIDVLSFSDFIAITPINTVIFDNVTMTTEMLKHFLSSLVHNKCLEKLSLRNVAIDSLGWKYLCQFLSKNTLLKKLDVSQQRIKSDTPAGLIRSSMDWPLLIKVLSNRGGMEELVINGCKIPDLIFASLIEQAVSLNTYRLGIAAMELNLFKTQTVANWINRPDSKCVGVDMAFNDLSSGQLKPIIDVFSKGHTKLLFFSLNSTKLESVDEFGELLRALCHVKTLRFLDLSSLPELFPNCISRLNKFLPHMLDLRRIHFDLNELTPQSISAIADILPKCPTLMHVSFLGNRQLNHLAAGTLYTAAKLSRSLFTLDLDYDLVSDELSQRIAFYLMRNMDITMNKDHLGKFTTAGADDDEELMFDGSLLMETAEKLISANDNEKDGKEADPKIQRLITNALIERTRAVRTDIHKTIDALFLKRTEGTLTLEGKETLLRFCLLDSSLEKMFHMFEEQVKRYSTTNFGKMSPSPSIDDNILRSDLVLGSSSKARPPIINEFSPQVTENRTSPGSSSSAESSRMQSLGGALRLGSLGLTLPPHDTLHESSSELITAGPILSPRNVEDTRQQQSGYFADLAFQPHTVVVDSSSDGKDVPIDYLTGRPVLMRSISQTSTHAKEQELEEGEFHRLGFYMQQREEAESALANYKEIPTLSVLPSGSELRDAIIAAKGIEKVTDLIDNINNNRISLDKIYNISLSDANPDTERPHNGIVLPTETQKTIAPCKPVSPTKSKSRSKSVDDEEKDVQDDSSIDSMEHHDPVDQMDHDKVVDEVYDKLLNDAQRVRSNKQE